MAAPLVVRQLAWIRIALDPLVLTPGGGGASGPALPYYVQWVGLAALGIVGCTAAIAYLLNVAPSWVGLSGAVLSMAGSWPIVWIFFDKAPAVGPAGFVLALLALGVLVQEKIRRTYRARAP